MNKYKYIPVVVIMGLSLLFGFNNCSNVSFSAQDATSKTTGTPNPPPPSQVITNCNNAASLGTLKTMSQTINFEDTAVETGVVGTKGICPFGQNDNLSMLDSHMRARYEQERVLNLPANAVICDVTMSTQLQSFKYDDVFFMMFNGRLLATNNKTAVNLRLTPESTIQVGNKNVNLFKYDWLELRDAPFQNVADDYCLGSAEGLSTCSWPITEQPGNINFQFDRELLIHLGLKSSSNFQAFQFVITGDNDNNIDCYHQKVEFDMQVKYYLQ